MAGKIIVTIDAAGAKIVWTALANSRVSSNDTVKIEYRKTSKINKCIDAHYVRNVLLTYYYFYCNRV